jgi:hypothetical protein
VACIPALPLAFSPAPPEVSDFDVEPHAESDAAKAASKAGWRACRGVTLTRIRFADAKGIVVTFPKP